MPEPVAKVEQTPRRIGSQQRPVAVQIGDVVHARISQTFTAHPDRGWLRFDGPQGLANRHFLLFGKRLTSDEQDREFIHALLDSGHRVRWQRKSQFQPHRLSGEKRMQLAKRDGHACLSPKESLWIR